MTNSACQREKATTIEEAVGIYQGTICKDSDSSDKLKYRWKIFNCPERTGLSSDVMCAIR